MDEANKDIEIKKVELPQQSVIISLVLVFLVLGISTIFYLAFSTNNQNVQATPTPDPNALKKFEPQTLGLNNIVQKQPRSMPRVEQKAPTYGPTKPSFIPSSTPTPSPEPSPTVTPLPSPTITPTPSPSPTIEPTTVETPSPSPSPSP